MLHLSGVEPHYRFDRRLPPAFFRVCQRHGIAPSRCVLLVRVAWQRLYVFERVPPRAYRFRRQLVCSTSRFGVGQRLNSNQTPLGLHRIAQKIGAGCPGGTVFRGRRETGFTWQGQPEAPIAHRILWLEGLEPGLNRGGDVDTKARYIYIHGLGDEPTLGRPASRGCIHLAAKDLLPIFDAVPEGTLVYVV